MVKVLVILLLFLLSCENSNSLIKSENNLDEVFFDVVEKKIIFEGDFPIHLKSVTTKWFENKVKVNGLEGSLKVFISNYNQNIYVIDKGKKIELSMDFLFVTQKKNLSQTKKITGKVNTYSTIEGDFSLNQVDELIINSQNDLIILLNNKLGSI